MDRYTRPADHPKTVMSDSMTLPISDNCTWNAQSTEINKQGMTTHGNGCAHCLSVTCEDTYTLSVQTKHDFTY